VPQEKGFGLLLLHYDTDKNLCLDFKLATFFCPKNAHVFNSVGWWE